MVKNHPNKPLLVVDNTFATPYLQRPLELGADLVVHSMTKYLGGHSDVVGGAIIGKTKNSAKTGVPAKCHRRVQGPMDSFLVLRGIKTLPIRMDRHAQNAEKIVAFLEKQKNVKRLIYPFHESHPQVQVAKRQMKNGGGMISFMMKDGREAAVKVAESTKYLRWQNHLGGVESLIEVPAAMTHLSTQGSTLEVDPGLVSFRWASKMWMTCWPTWNKQIAAMKAAFWEVYYPPLLRVIATSVTSSSCLEPFEGLQGVEQAVADLLRGEGHANSS
jgi:cystathionine gamma-synthase